jgi:hypothetical protein
VEKEDNNYLGNNRPTRNHHNRNPNRRQCQMGLSPTRISLVPQPAIKGISSSKGSVLKWRLRQRRERPATTSEKQQKMTENRENRLKMHFKLEHGLRVASLISYINRYASRLAHSNP